MNILTNNESPNFTIILPGPCNADCSFCTWKENPEASGFLTGLEYALKNLPIMFQQISISGGEPTISPYLRETLAIIRKYRNKFKKVVLTTNGTRLFTDPLQNGLQLNSLQNIVDHINISRHASDDIDNIKVFDTNGIPSTAELELLAHRLHNSSLDSFIDLNYNCVLTEGIDHDPVKWIKFMDRTGIQSVTFRNQYDDDSTSQIEQEFIDAGMQKTSESNCPVCRTTVYRINGFTFKFHSSAFEPIKIFNGLNIPDETYEVILQSNGNITRDWEGKSILYSAEATFDRVQVNDAVIKEYQDYPEVQRGIQEDRARAIAEREARRSTSYSGCGSSSRSYSSCG